MALILWGQGIDTVRSNCSTAIDDAAVVINANVLKSETGPRCALAFAPRCLLDTRLDK